MGGILIFNPKTTPRRLALVINSLDINSGSNLSVRTYSDILKTHHIFSVTLESCFDTILCGAGCRWMEIEKANSDNQPGTFDTTDDHSWTNPQPGTSRKITFSSAYLAPPKVFSRLKSLDTNSDRGSRVNLYTTEVTKVGFTINIDIWGHSEIYSCGATWIAYPIDMKNVASGVVQTAKSSDSSSDYVKFGFMGFMAPPRVLLGISKLNFTADRRLRISLTSSEVSKEGMRWQIATSDNVLSADASYIALSQ